MLCAFLFTDIMAYIGKVERLFGNAKRIGNIIGYLLLIQACRIRGLVIWEEITTPAIVTIEEIPVFKLASRIA